MPLELAQRWKSYTDPWQIVSLGAGFVFRSFKPGTPQNRRGLENAFAEFYKVVGHHFAAYEDTTCVPSLVASCRGTILELGPAIGNQLPRFSKENIKHIYGVEPNDAFTNALREKIVETGFQDLYTPIVCGIEDRGVLQSHDIINGSIDTVLSIQVLCSVAVPLEAAKVIYDLLKPGGELIFWEHHKSNDWVTWAMQKLWNPGWSLAVGGCRLDCAIMEAIMEAGSWEVVELDGNEKPWSMKPQTWGRLRKIGKVDNKVIN